MSEKTKVAQSVKFFKKNFPGFRPKALLVLGTGLGELRGSLEPGESLAYHEIPHFPRSTVKGHTGSLCFCRTNGLDLAVLRGRVHAYEGYSSQEVVRTIRVIRLLGAETAVLTNAAGSLNPLFDQGSIMCISDHINLTGENPLIGQDVQEWGPLFPDMSRVYCPNLRNMVQKAALRLGFVLNTGVYVGIKGPSLETPAETRAFRNLGGDAIGMSTVLEVIAARHMGMGILGLSCLTNKNLPDCMAETSHEEILEAAGNINKQLSRLLQDFFSSLSRQLQGLENDI